MTRLLFPDKPCLEDIRSVAYKYLSESRILHVRGCEETAVRLAERYDYDPYRAAFAAILHDITKKLDYSEQLILIDKYDIICDVDEKNMPKLLHALTGAALSRDLFAIPDDVYSAIRWHTTGKPDMSVLEKIIYLADYIEPSRNFDGVNKLRKACEAGLDEGMLLGLAMGIDDLRSSGTEPHHHSIDAYNWYKDRRN